MNNYSFPFFFWTHIALVNDHITYPAAVYWSH